MLSQIKLVTVPWPLIVVYQLSGNVDEYPNSICLNSCLFVFFFFPMTINKELNTKAHPSVGIAANITAYMNKEAGSVLHFVRLSIKCCGLEQLTASVVLLL